VIQTDVIVAPATPPGASALAVVRLSGGGCASLAERMLGLPAGRLSGMRRAVGAAGGSLEPAMSAVAFSWPEGRSFTGEEMVDIMCFGSPGVVEAVLKAALEEGARPAGPGEFSRRALASGRMSPLELMALASAWSPGTPLAGGGSGDLESEARRLLDFLQRLQEELEGSIEFGEAAGVDSMDRDEALAVLGRARAAAASITAAAAAAEGPFRVFVMGPANSGKSSLFNLLVGRKRAVVSPEPGTTRDGAMETISIDGIICELADTAGPGPAAGPDVDALSISLAELRAGDCILWLSRGGSQGIPSWACREGVRRLALCSCCDLSRGDGLNISSLTGEGIGELRRWIASEAGSVGAAASAGRLESLLAEASSFLESGEDGLATAALGEALALLGWLVDRSDAPGTALERVLSRMCVGK